MVPFVNNTDVRSSATRCIFLVLHQHHPLHTNAICKVGSVMEFTKNSSKKSSKKIVKKFVKKFVKKIRNLKEPTPSNTEKHIVTKENEEHFWWYQSRFLEALLVRQADGELKNLLTCRNNSCEDFPTFPFWMQFLKTPRS